jgi:hypothetical protein
MGNDSCVPVGPVTRKFIVMSWDVDVGGARQGQGWWWEFRFEIQFKI